MKETSSDRHKAIVSEVHLLRGVIVSSYAHVEFLLGDLCMKAWRTTTFSHLRDNSLRCVSFACRRSRQTRLRRGPRANRINPTGRKRSAGLSTRGWQEPRPACAGVKQ
jgi:hypothetical protein